MRAIGAAVLAIGYLSSPAHARERLARAGSIAVPIAASAVLAMAPDRKIAALPTIALSLTPGLDRSGSVVIRRGFGAAATSLYPFRASGLHLTIGTRLATHALAGIVEAPWTPLLWAPRGSGPRSTRRMSAMALVGFDRPVADGVTLGLDAGMAQGHINRFTLGPRAAAGGRLAGGQAVNPLARMTVAYRF